MICVCGHEREIHSHRQVRCYGARLQGSAVPRLAKDRPSDSDQWLGATHCGCLEFRERKGLVHEDGGAAAAEFPMEEPA